MIVTTTYRFQEVKRSTVFKLKCPTCGKRFQRVLSATMTVSPFNKNPDGTIRTFAEVWAAVGKDRDALKLNRFRSACPKCDTQADVISTQARDY